MSLQTFQPRVSEAHGVVGAPAGSGLDAQPNASPEPSIMLGVVLAAAATVAVVVLVDVVVLLSWGPVA